MTPAEQLAWARNLVNSSADPREVDHVILDLVEGLHSAMAAMAVELLQLQIAVRDRPR